jgi:hypothetical protein
MLTNIKLLLEIGSDSTRIIVSDRHKNVLQTIYNVQEVLIENKIEFPNTLTLAIDNPTGTFIKLKDLWLGGIKLPKNVLYQIGNFTDTKSNSTYTTYWTTSGTATINFHSNDFIQYHLIYGNKLRALLQT